jgi:thymidylate synthase ThyX
MSYEAKVLADHLAPCGKRIVTFEVTFPRIVLAEFNTHRMLSRNSASSRAIPIEKMLAHVTSDPFIPTYWGKNQKGMQADEELSAEEQYDARYAWLSARDEMVRRARALAALGAHKQTTNRLLEPFLWQTVLVTATEFDNFFALRTHRDAQPEIREIATRMERLYCEHEPVEVEAGFWHLPLVEDRAELEAAGYTPEQVRQISVGRCARVSYLTHDGKRDPQADIDLCARLRASGHMSPFEHVAEALPTCTPSGNFVGWAQYRKGIAGEAIYQPG